MPRVLLIGSPPFAEPIRERLASLGWLAGVLTVPPRPRGRGRTIPSRSGWNPDGRTVLAPPQPTPEAVQVVLERVRPEAVVLASYGRILPAATLALLPEHRVNIHPSLLPRWRGAAPIPRTILAGDVITGVTLHELVEAVDAGPIVAQERYPLLGTETTGSLVRSLAELGARMVEAVLPGYCSGSVRTAPQPIDGITPAPRISVDEAQISAFRTAVELERSVRAFDPWPRARFEIPGTTVLVHAARVVPGNFGEPGTLMAYRGELVLATAAGGLALTCVQRPGRSPVDGPAFLRGLRATLPVRLQSPAGTSA